MAIHVSPALLVRAVCTHQWGKAQVNDTDKCWRHQTFVHDRRQARHVVWTHACAVKVTDTPDLYVYATKLLLSWTRQKKKTQETIDNAYGKFMYSVYCRNRDWYKGCITRYYAKYLRVCSAVWRHDPCILYNNLLLWCIKLFQKRY